MSPAAAMPNMAATTEPQRPAPATPRAASSASGAVPSAGHRLSGDSCCIQVCLIDNGFLPLTLWGSAETTVGELKASYSGIKGIGIQWVMALVNGRKLPDSTTLADLIPDLDSLPPALKRVDINMAFSCVAGPGPPTLVR